MVEMPIILQIEKVKSENSNIKTFYFKYSLDYKPGQFLMIWVPGIDEKPFSVSSIKSNSFAITVEKKGGFTEELFTKKPGDKIGIRGPYGNPFTIMQGRTCVIGGGCGIAPIMPLIEKLNNPTIIVGCQTAKRILFKDKVEKFNVCTDDGTYGYHGFTTEKFKEILNNESSFEMVYTCGPEPMMKAVFDICQEQGILCEASLERFMICGIGVCGQCMCDNLRICKDGPVLGTKQLEQLKDFGKYAMIKTGMKVPLKEYYAYKTKY